jgi:TPR repeat protein
VVTRSEIAETAAEQADAEVRFNLGEACYENFEYAEAVKWWRRAAEQGCQAAQYQLGCAYSKGEGIAKDYVMAHMWFDLSWNSEVKNVGPNPTLTP